MSAGFTYKPIFDDGARPSLLRNPAPFASVGDRSPRDSYVFDDAIRLRVNLALATGRPLLVRGPSGSGKSALARAIAERTDWNYIERVITSTTRAQDLLYEIDHLARLRDAQTNRLGRSMSKYLRPGPLFFAFDAAAARGFARAPAGTATERELTRPWVVLLDEIDKADPDVPNNLLGPIGRLEFEIPELERVISGDPARLPLLVLTTNDERELSPAFQRRCIELVIDNPDVQRLVDAATAHRLDGAGVDLNGLATSYLGAPRSAGQAANIAEFLDFVRAWRELELSGDEETLRSVLAAITGASRDV